MMNFANFNSVISQVIMNYEGQVLSFGEEAQHLAIVVEELLLRSNASTAKGLLQELLQVGVLLLWDFFLGISERIFRANLSFRLRLSDILK